MTSRGSYALVLGWLAALAAGCTPHDNESPDASVEPSPNASILPAPLNSGTRARPKPRTHADAGIKPVMEGGVIAPTTLRDDEPLAVDEVTGKDMLGVEMEAAFDWPDQPHPLPLPDAPQDVARTIRQITTLSVRITLAHAGRMRFDFVGRGFALPAGTELRARPEYYGTVLVWPGGGSYRTLVPGVLRALLEEGRADAAPLVQPKITRQPGPTVLGQKTQRLQLDTPTGKLSLDQASNASTGNSGQLLCRVLIELAGSEPDADACASDTVPLAAEYQWAEGGRLSFVVSSVSPRKDLALESLSVPPTGASFRLGELPARPTEALLDAATLGQIRSHAARVNEPTPQGPAKILALTNHTDTGRYLLLDGIPLIWIPARGEASVFGIKPGHYGVSWRDFYATQVSPTTTALLPGRLVVGSELDAGKGP